MKHFLISLLAFLFVLTQAQAQLPQHSYHGNVHTPKGDLHLLVIFVRYDNQKGKEGNEKMFHGKRAWA
ncbi:MAG: hypothetical protein AAFP02_01460, partial [Bacteroidota bacterium]